MLVWEGGLAGFFLAMVVHFPDIVGPCGILHRPQFHSSVVFLARKEPKCFNNKESSIEVLFDICKFRLASSSVLRKEFKGMPVADIVKIKPPS